MKPLPRTIHGRDDPFAPTHWSVVLAAARADENSREAEVAVAKLCQTYWAPLYTFVRGRGHAPHDAQDLTQSFFAHLIEHRIYEHSDPAKGKFRAFLLASIKNYLADARIRAATLKRGGGYHLVPLHIASTEEAESFFQTHHFPQTPASQAERSFERSWAHTLVNTALARLAEDYRRPDKRRFFDTLRVFIAHSAEHLPAYEALAETLGMPASTIRSHVTRMRTRYREILRAEVRRTVNTVGEVQGELRELLRVLMEE